jgi:hypothetical protein
MFPPGIKCAYLPLQMGRIRLFGWIKRNMAFAGLAIKYKYLTFYVDFGSFFCQL